MKKNKKMLLLGAIVLTVIILGVWLFSLKSTTTTAATVTSSEDEAIRAKIRGSINRIKAAPEWYEKLKAELPTDGSITLNQSVANSAIWALKVDGDIPMNTFGVGEWGHIDFIKANY